MVYGIKDCQLTTVGYIFGAEKLLVYIGFLDWELKLLRKAAAELGKSDQCEFRDNISDFADDGTLVATATDRRTFPSVIFLSMEAKTGAWKQSLTALKSHRVLSRVPVIGLGDLPLSDVSDVYDLGGNSYIEKPDTFDAMMRAAKISLSFWLDVSILPREHLEDL